MRPAPFRFVLSCWLLSAVWASPVLARPFRVQQIPNGWVNGCANCHEHDGAGGPRNPFGTTVETSFLSTPGPTGQVMWGPALAAIDSDGDGRSNGRELLDPTGAWAIGQPHPGHASLVRLPGFVDAAPVGVPALPPLGLAFLAAALAGIGVSSLRPSRACAAGFRDPAR